MKSSEAIKKSRCTFVGNFLIWGTFDTIKMTYMATPFDRKSTYLETLYNWKVQ